MTASGSDPAGNAPARIGKRRIDALEIGLAVFWVLFGAALVVLASGIRVPAISDPIGPHGLPVGIGVLIAVLGLFIGARAILGAPEREPTAVDALPEDDMHPFEPLRLFGSLGILAGYLLIMPVITFIPATIAAGALVLLVQGARGPIVVLLPAGLAVGLYLIFTSILQVQFP
jgi:hypothetical protein